MSRGLMTRIAGASDADVRRVDPLESVLAHLRNLLNTRQGSVSSLPDYGVPDFTDVVRSIPDGLVDMCDAIRATIARYEPRLTGVVVQPAPLSDPGAALHFVISGRFVATQGRRAIRFATRVMPGGHIELE